MAPSNVNLPNTDFKPRINRAIKEKWQKIMEQLHKQIILIQPITNVKP